SLGKSRKNRTSVESDLGLGRSVFLFDWSDDANPEFDQLIATDDTRRVRHQIGRFGGFGKRDDFADRFSFTKDHRQAIHAPSNAAVRRRAVLESLDEETELLPRLVARKPERAKHRVLNFGPMDTNRTTAQLITVADEIVRFGE